VAETKHTFSVEAAGFLRVGRSAIYEAVRRGTVDAVRLGERIIIPKRALEKLLGEDGSSPAAPPTAAESPAVLWKPCPCCEGTGVVGVKPGRG
jgi:excisionase family DNA binding protein